MEKTAQRRTIGSWFVAARDVAVVGRGLFLGFPECAIFQVSSDIFSPFHYIDQLISVTIGFNRVPDNCRPNKYQELRAF